MNIHACATRVSNVWKMKSQFFQCLEKAVAGFPNIGKSRGCFSKHWKILPAAALLLAAAGPGRAEVADPAFSNTIAQTTALITNLMAQHAVPALSIALVSGSNIVWAQGFGMADREANIPASENTIYRLASVSKTFAAASTLRLQDAGRLSILDDVTQTIPAFAMLPRYTNQAVTIRELLAHQAQLPGCYFRHADSTIPYDGYYDMMLAFLAEDYMVEPPRFLEKYNNNGFTLIEGVVAGANTNGLTYAAFAATNLFQPMAMSNTAFRLAGDQTNRLARIYRNGVRAPDEYVNTPGSGGAYSSAADMARYARFLLGYGAYDGVRILSSNAVAALWSDQSAQVALVNKEGHVKSGLGWDQIADPSFAYAGTMAWKDGDSLNYSAIICVMPERGLAAVALNSIPGADNAAAPAAKMALKLALLERDGIPLPPTNPPAFPASPVTVLTEQELAGIVGRYSAEGGYSLVTGTVAAITWITDAGGAAPVRYEGLVPHADGWFCVTSQPAFRLAFTNIGGRVILRRQAPYENYLQIVVQAERFTPAPLSAAWSNRVGKTWVTADLEPESYLWLLGMYPTLQLDIHDGVLTVYSAPCMTLQPQNDDLAFPFSMNAPQPSALLVKHTNGHEVIRYSGYDFQSVNDLPVLQAGRSVTGTLAAGETALYQVNVTDSVWHNLAVMPTSLVLRLDPAADLATPGSYALILQNPGAASAPFSLRLYNLTSTIARVSALVTNLAAQHGLVGCGLALVDGAHTVWQTGFGLADRERGIPADAGTVFMIGSCSKTFGTLAAMQLVERGLMDLDAPFTNYLPTFSIHQRFADNVITPRTILTHHSGLPGDIFNGAFTVRPNYAAPDEIQAMLADEYTLMPTNTFWAYNNSGFVMLGQAVRHVTGQAVADYMRTNLFDRAAMTNSSMVYDLPYIASHMARPYIAGQLGPDEYCDVFLAGSIYATAADMARYMRMLLAGGRGDNGRVISNATLAAMSVKQNADVPLDRFNTQLNMGIGFILDPPTLQYMGKVIWHDGGTVYFRTLLRVATEAGLGCFISWNTAEGGSVNTEIVDSALKWAYEEKTGIAPPAPCEPGTPAAAVAPPEIVALATGGVYVTGNGYDAFATNASGLVIRRNAQAGSPSDQDLLYREDGWFTPTNAYTPQIAFTQVAGRIVYLMRNFAGGVTNMGIVGERAADLAGFDPAWNSRLGRWWVTDLHPDDISWPMPEVMCFPMVELYAKDQMLIFAPLANRASGNFVMAATNDGLAFAAGLGRNKGSALRASGDDIAFMGNRYRAQGGIPLLLPGGCTNGVTSGNEVYWFRIPAAPGQDLTVDLASDSELTTWLYDTNCVAVGQANRAHAFHLDATNARPLMAAVVRNGTNVGPWRLNVYTSAIPFYVQESPANWPTELMARSNLYGALDFGHVFVHENHTNQAGKILRIAVARMNSPNPAAPPLFFCEGGPGDSAIRCPYQHFMKAFTDAYDVYLIDQRGVGYSQPDLALKPQESPTDLQYRLGMLQDSDLSAINTLESSRDLDDLAAAMALTNANLHGLSYGTLLAQTLMRREPAWLRAVILDGVMAPNITPFSQTGPIRNNALNALFAGIAANPRAVAWYPGFPTTFYTLGTNLQNHPVTLQYSGITNQMDGLAYLDAVLQQMTVSDLGTRERIPNIAYRAAGEETAALAELYTGFNLDTNSMIRSVVSTVMQMLVIKHDILPFDSLAAASNACASLSPLLRQLNLNFMQGVVDGANSFDPAGQADPSFILPVTSAIPTLVINGTFDTQTGTNWAAEVARHLPNAFLVIVPTVGHGVLQATNGCTLQAMRSFLANPWQDPTPTCLTNLQLLYPAPWPTQVQALAFNTAQTNAFAVPNSGLWYALTLQPNQRVAMAASGVTFRVVSATNAAVLAESMGGVLDWRAGSGTAGYYLWIVAAQPGSLRFTPHAYAAGLPGAWFMLLDE